MEAGSGWGREAGKTCEELSGSAPEADNLPLEDGLEVPGKNLIMEVLVDDEVLEGDEDGDEEVVVVDMI